MTSCDASRTSGRSARRSIAPSPLRRRKRLRSKTICAFSRSACHASTTASRARLALATSTTKPSRRQRQPTRRSWRAHRRCCTCSSARVLTSPRRSKCRPKGARGRGQQGATRGSSHLPAWQGHVSCAHLPVPPSGVSPAGWRRQCTRAFAGLHGARACAWRHGGGRGHGHWPIPTQTRTHAPHLTLTCADHLLALTGAIMQGLFARIV
mmetsp:Transcript_9859/g.26798  ORF Transcript_9859/g.26798 Transcript_9859/m.26798 type:complete len:209 (+) Transcript_9859:194-820(+)